MENGTEKSTDNWLSMDNLYDGLFEFIYWTNRHFNGILFKYLICIGFIHKDNNKI